MCLDTDIKPSESWLMLGRFSFLENVTKRKEFLNIYKPLYESLK